MHSSVTQKIRKINTSLELDEYCWVNDHVWSRAIQECINDGFESAPRGYKIKEMFDRTLIFDPRYPIVRHVERKYNVSYLRQELLWKLRANRFDASICRHAKMWESVQNTDGSFNSNYGIYWFGEQRGAEHVVNELIYDRDSRRAVIPMLSKDHLSDNDVVCTECIGFRIRANALHMSVHMRSSDVVFGLGTDVPSFAFLYRIVFGLLSEYYDLRIGQIAITAMSSHIYERHFEMAQRIYCNPAVQSVIHMPFCTLQEAHAIIQSKSNPKILSQAGDLGQWLIS